MPTFLLWGIIRNAIAQKQRQINFKINKADALFLTLLCSARIVEVLKGQISPA